MADRLFLDTQTIWYREKNKGTIANISIHLCKLTMKCKSLLPSHHELMTSIYTSLRRLWRVPKTLNPPIEASSIRDLGVSGHVAPGVDHEPSTPSTGTTGHHFGKTLFPGDRCDLRGPIRVRLKFSFVLESLEIVALETRHV